MPLTQFHNGEHFKMATHPAYAFLMGAGGNSEGSQMRRGPQYYMRYADLVQIIKDYAREHNFAHVEAKDNAVIDNAVSAEGGRIMQGLTLIPPVDKENESGSAWNSMVAKPDKYVLGLTHEKFELWFQSVNILHGAPAQRRDITCISSLPHNPGRYLCCQLQKQKRSGLDQHITYVSEACTMPGAQMVTLNAEDHMKALKERRYRKGEHLIDERKPWRLDPDHIHMDERSYMADCCSSCSSSSNGAVNGTSAHAYSLYWNKLKQAAEGSFPWDDSKKEAEWRSHFPDIIL